MPPSLVSTLISSHTLFMEIPNVTFDIEQILSMLKAVNLVF